MKDFFVCLNSRDVRIGNKKINTLDMIEVVEESTVESKDSMA